jgi:hypothetical protein
MDKDFQCRAVNNKRINPCVPLGRGHMMIGSKSITFQLKFHLCFVQHRMQTEWQRNKHMTLETCTYLGGQLQHHHLLVSEIDGDVFVAQTFTILVAGFETSCNTLCYVTQTEGWDPADAEQTQRRADIWWHTGNVVLGQGCVRWGDWSRLY